MSYVNTRSALFISRLTSSQWIAQNPVLPQSYVGVETDTGKLKWGDGVSTWTSLKYSVYPLSEIEGVAVGSGVIGTAFSAARADHSHDIAFIDAGYIDPANTFQPTEESNPLSIVISPKNTESEAGGRVFFRVRASGGSLSYTYQWQILYAGDDGWEDIDDNITFIGSLTDTLTVSNITNNINLAKFRVRISDGVTSLFSTEAMLNISYFEITQQPVSTGVIIGAVSPAVTFSISAQSDDPITYQWQRLNDNAWINIVGATNSTYGSISGVIAPNGDKFYGYRCAVTANTATLNSDSVMLNLIDLSPTIISHPSGTTATSGSASFSVSYTVPNNQTESSIRWQVKQTETAGWIDIYPSNNTTLVLSNLRSENSGSEYRAIITTVSSSVISQSATLSVPGPRITSQPYNTTAVSGSASFVIGFSPNNATVQWQKRKPSNSLVWQNIAGANSATLALNNLTTSDSTWEYRAIVSFDGQTESTLSAELTVPPTPTTTPPPPPPATTTPAPTFATITEHPASVTVDDGETAVFRFNATGLENEDRFFQWQFYSTAPGSSWQPVPGTTQVIRPGETNIVYRPLNIVGTQTISGTKYRGYLRNGTEASPGTKIRGSTAATLTVTQAQLVLSGVLPGSRPAGMGKPTRSLPNNRSVIVDPAKASFKFADFAYARGRIIGISHGGISAGTSGTSNTVYPFYGTPNFIYSDNDGATWETKSFPVSLDWQGIASSGGIFAAVGVLPDNPSIHVLVVSTDKGESWSVINWVSGGGLSIIGSQSSGFLIWSGETIYSYTGGNNVTRKTGGTMPLGHPSGGGRIGNMWVLKVYQDIWYSSDAVTWTRKILPGSPPGLSVYNHLAVSNTYAVSMGTDGVWVSSDGVGWVFQGIPPLEPPKISGVSNPAISKNEVYSVGLAGNELAYAQFASGSGRVANRAVFGATDFIWKASAGSPISATTVFDYAAARTAQDFAFSNFVTTDRYIIAIDTHQNIIVRMPTIVRTVDPSNPSTINPIDGSPSQPASLTATALSGTAVALAWTVAPAGGSTILGYKIQRHTGSSRPSQDGGWVDLAQVAANATAYNVTGLSSGQTYLFRVAARNSFGTGVYSNPVSVTTTQTFPPTAPRQVAVSILPNSPMVDPMIPGFQLSWLAPVSDGGTPILRYDVQYRKQALSTIEQSYTESAFTGSNVPFRSLSERTTGRQDSVAYNTWVTITGQTAVASVKTTRERETLRGFVFQFRVAAVTEVGVSDYTTTNLIVYQLPQDSVDTWGYPSALAISFLEPHPMSRNDGPGLQASWLAPTPLWRYPVDGYAVEYRYQIVNGETRGTPTNWIRLGERNTTNSSRGHYYTWITRTGQTAVISITGLNPNAVYGVQIRVAGVYRSRLGPFVESNTLDWNEPS